MIEKIFVYESGSVDPYYNLAAEQHLLELVQPGCCILYLWQNQNTVVIGSNQNPWNECRVSLLETEGGRLARRLSGGGAVYHDLGNLNFTFLMWEADYDVQKQLDVIRVACKAFGIQAEPSGRNDLLADGRKFSGNAFYHHQGKAYHHGTLLINADTQKMQRYLSPPKAKLDAKGVSSVRSRVLNLNELSPGLTCEKMKKQMASAFGKVYGIEPQMLWLNETDLAAVSELQQRYASWDYLYGKPLPFSFSCESRFPWGHIQLQLQLESGTVLQAKVYSDAMDHLLAPKLEQGLAHCRFTLDELQEAVRSHIDQQEIANHICQMLVDQDI